MYVSKYLLRYKYNNYRMTVFPQTKLNKGYFLFVYYDAKVLTPSGLLPESSIITIESNYVSHKTYNCLIHI